MTPPNEQLEILIGPGLSTGSSDSIDIQCDQTRSANGPERRAISEATSNIRTDTRKGPASDQMDAITPLATRRDDGLVPSKSTPSADALCSGAGWSTQAAQVVSSINDLCLDSAWDLEHVTSFTPVDGDMVLHDVLEHIATGMKKKNRIARRGWFMLVSMIASCTRSTKSHEKILEDCEDGLANVSQRVASADDGASEAMLAISKRFDAAREDDVRTMILEAQPNGNDLLGHLESRQKL